MPRSRPAGTAAAGIVEVPVREDLPSDLDIGPDDPEGLGAEPLAERQVLGDLAPESLILAIETSCDETSVAVLRGDSDILANVVSSQAALHERYGGIVPELASRAHVQAINPALAEALRQADVTFWDIDAVAVTVGPGLIGSLVVGVAAAKSLAALLEVPLIGVNHLEAHIYANFLEHPACEPPLIALIVSGGHTLLVHMPEHGEYELLGETLDDAAGEAFDKVARYLSLGYPGGPVVDKLGASGNPMAIAFPRPILREGYDFSFSGLKTAVLTYVEGQRRAGSEPDSADLCASFQEALVDCLVTKTLRAATEREVTTVVIAGGVAANSRLREAIGLGCEQANLRLFYPSPGLCTDNAAMVAGCGYYRYHRGVRTQLDVSPDPNLPIV